MSNPASLANDDTWTGGFVPGLPADLCRITGRQGVMLLASDRQLLRQTAAEEHPVARPMPDGVGPVRALSVERRLANPRIAVAGARRILILDGKRIASLTVKSGSSPVEAIAWGPHPKRRSAVYMMTEDGGLDRALPDTQEMEEVPVGYLVAMAAGEDGTLAVASIDPEAPAVWTTRNGEQWQYRVLKELEGSDGWDLAVSGDAVALALAWRGVWVSRGLDEPFTKCDVLGHGGALVFAGSGTDAPLVCAVHEGLSETLVRVDAGGAASRIATIDTPRGGEEPRMASLAWDASRGTVWGLLSEGGLLRVERRQPGSTPPLVS